MNTLSTPKKLYKSRNKWLAGVAGGVAEYFNIDPTIVRVIWLILALAYGAGILAYIIAWLVVPKNPN
jgi:phage shock protein PspC (stress-responsive transcriptional regulator)